MDYSATNKKRTSGVWGANWLMGGEEHRRWIKHRGGLAVAMVLWLSRRRRKCESCALLAFTLLVCQVVRWW
jgi:hypothetical protein